MRPILIDFGIDIPWLGRARRAAYFTALALSFLVGLWMMRREAPKLGLDRGRIFDLWIDLILWAVVGSRVLHVIADGHFHEYVNLCVTTSRSLPPRPRSPLQRQLGVRLDYVCNLAAHTCHPPRDCLAVFKVWRGGLAYYGGFIFAAVFGITYARKHRMGQWVVADLAAPWIAFGLALTRVGCFSTAAATARCRTCPGPCVSPWDLARGKLSTPPA